MSNKLLRKLGDTKNRKLPLIYKYMVEEIIENGNIETGYIFTSSKRNAKSKCFDYHKPISKIM